MLYRKKSPYPSAAHPAYREGIRQRGLEILKDPNAAVRPYLDIASLYRRAEAPAPDDAALTYTLEQIIQIVGWLKTYRIEVDIGGA